jgi:hypothetical protein
MVPETHFTANEGTLPVQVKATAAAYTFHEFSPGERMVLKVDPNWYGTRPYYDEIVEQAGADGLTLDLSYANFGKRSTKGRGQKCLMRASRSLLCH